MGGERKKFALGELCSLITDGKHGDSDDDANSGYFFLSVKDILDNRLVYDNARQITKEDFLETHRRTNLEPGDILFTNTGTIGRMAIAPEDPKTYRTTFQKSVAILKPRRELVYPLFLYYLLHSESSRLSEFAAGTSQKNLLLKDIRKFTVDIPASADQRAIISILKKLDEKIELNRWMNETIDAIARAIFISWFVDFDPVRAKVEGSYLGLPSHVADLFPDRFEKSEIGEIPEGWNAGNLSDLICRRKERIGDKEAIVLSAVASGELVRSDENFKKRVYSKDITKYFTVEQWDIAYNPSRINIGSVGMLKEPIIGAVSPAYVVARPEHSYRWFIEFSLRRKYTWEWINILASGSVRQSLNFVNFTSIPYVIPPVSVVQTFNKLWSQLCDLIDVRMAETQTLIELRSLLLPKLISGELHVPEAEQLIGKVM